MPLLSTRERDVVQLLLEGKSNKLIARALNVAERTVEFHLTNTFAKFQVNSRMELVLYLNNHPEICATEKLRLSTVAEQAMATDNEDKFNLRYWAKSLKVAANKIGKELNMESSLNSEAQNGTSITFYNAIRRCLFVKYADFTGQASRPEFWWFALFVIIVASALMLINEILSSVFLLAMLLPLLAVGTRRLRDSGKSGWWQLFLLAPVAGIVVLGFLWAMPPADLHPEEESQPA